MFCRQCGEQYLSDQEVICHRCGTPKGCGYNYCPVCGSPVVNTAAVCVHCGSALTNMQMPVADNRKSKIAAGLLGIFLGSLGVHNFYLGYTNKAIIQIVVCLAGGVVTCGIASAAVSIWGLVEGIMILAGSINVDGNGVPLKD